MTTESATYVYCVVKGERKPRFARTAPRLDGGGAPRAVDAGDGYAVVVATVPLETYSATAIEDRLGDLDWVGAAAAAHEAVVERAGKTGTVVPMKLFTLFRSDERALEHIRKTKRRLDGVVARIDGCEEWGLRVLFDETAAAAAPSGARDKRGASKAGAGAGSASSAGAESGAAFLSRKKAQADHHRTLAATARSRVDELHAALEKVAKKARRRAAPNRELAARVLLDAVFLVPRPKLARFKAVVSETADEIAGQGFHVTLTGPWPAYSFIEVE